MEELNFNEWFKVFLEEKGLSETVIEFDDSEDRTWVQMPIEVIQEYLSFCSEEVQEKFEFKVVELDFCNMNIATFLEFIAKGIEKVRGI